MAKGIIVNPSGASATEAKKKEKKKIVKEKNDL